MQGALATAEGRAGGAAAQEQRPDPLGRLLGAEPPRGRAKWDFLPALLGVGRRAADRQPHSTQVNTVACATLVEAMAWTCRMPVYSAFVESESWCGTAVNTRRVQAVKIKLPFCSPP